MSGVKSGVLCRSSSVLLCKLTRSALANESRQQLERCLAATVWAQDITVICTIHFHPWLHENQTSAPQPDDTDWNQHAGTCLSVYHKPVRDVNELTQHLIETWSATSKASLIKRLISSKIVLMHVSKPKAFAILFLRNCHDLCFISQGSVRTAVIRGGQFCCFTIG